MQVIGFGSRSLMVILAMRPVDILESIMHRPDMVMIEECAHLPRMDMMAQPMDESPHPGERHRDNVRRVNSGRSRAGKAARWA